MINQQKDYDSLYCDTRFAQWSGIEPSVSLRYVCKILQKVSHLYMKINKHFTYREILIFSFGVKKMAIVVPSLGGSLDLWLLD